MENKLRVLCLHGYRQDAEKFRQQTGALRKVLKNVAEFEFVSAPHEVAGEGPASRSWWFTQPQSFSSRDKSEMCLGLDESVMLIEKVWLDKGPFHGLLGFSQGACFVGILAALSNKRQVSIFPRFVVLISGFISQCMSHKLFYTDQINLPSLHVFGEGDEVIPWEWSETLSQQFCNPEILKHPGGHFVGGTSTNKADYQIFFKHQMDLVSTIH